MKVLVTGAQGFVAKYLIESIQRSSPRAEIIPTSKDGGHSDDWGRVAALDITIASQVDEVIRASKPTHIAHLAGLAAIPSATAHPDEAWRVHLNGTLNIANAVLSTDKNCVLLYVGSGQVYGNTGRAGVPLTEQAVLAPNNTYTASKAAADLAVGAMAGEGLKAIRMRPFNHTGPGQSSDFVVPSFAHQIARIVLGLQPAEMLVGNLEAERDFLDVRDVADAYTRALVLGNELEPGVILNIASGVPRRIGDILHQLVELSGSPIKIFPDESRMRSSDMPIFVGDATRARRLLGWEVQYPFDQTLRDILDWAIEYTQNLKSAEANQSRR
jgi:GDP-4-dehydro-6-deoxy-D-mannose reductase